MRFIAILLMALLFAASMAMADRPVKDVVKRFDNMRLVYTESPDGHTIPLVTNLDQKGRRMGPKVPPAPDWSKPVRRLRAPQQRPISIRPAEEITVYPGTGIPIPPDYNLLRPINPFVPVNPNTNPLAIPTP